MMLTKILAAGCLACVLAAPCTALQVPPGSPIPPQADPNCVAVGERKIKPSDLARGDIYAAAMAVDGNVALVASEWDDDQGKDSGAVFVTAATDANGYRSRSSCPATVRRVTTSGAHSKWMATWPS
jgi:hypothetical protein